ncbi:hypothetical protein DL765_010121 [Monosporascus sp. GIB2]|nr:hypothetical protein DL765_010121 [Monosporascus sp. GIB2]
MAPTRPTPRPKPRPRPLTPAEARAKNGVLTQNGTKFLCNGGKCREVKNTTKDVASHICKKHPPEGKTSAYQRFTDYKPENADLIQAQRNAQKRKQRRVKRIIVVLLGYAVMIGMLYLILTTQRSVNKIWNPYDILGISESASEKEIKSHYKKLGRKFHPDKIRPDPAKNETIESLNSVWVEYTKAYQALTDEEVRNNYIQYGHPDGKQGFSIGIALPKFIVSDGNGKYVVLVYALLLGVLLPYYVGSWWYGTQRVTREGVQVESANKLFRDYSENIDVGGLITALSNGKEFRDLFRGNKAESGEARRRGQPC